MYWQFASNYFKIYIYQLNFFFSKLSCFCVYSDEVQNEGVCKANIGVTETGIIDRTSRFDLCLTIEASEEES